MPDEPARLASIYGPRPGQQPAGLQPAGLQPAQGPGYGMNGRFPDCALFSVVLATYFLMLDGSCTSTHVSPKFPVCFIRRSFLRLNGGVDGEDILHSTAEGDLEYLKESRNQGMSREADSVPHPGQDQIQLDDFPDLDAARYFLNTHRNEGDQSVEMASSESAADTEKDVGGVEGGDVSDACTQHTLKEMLDGSASLHAAARYLVGASEPRAHLVSLVLAYLKNMHLTGGIWRLIARETGCGPENLASSSEMWYVAV